MLGIELLNAAHVLYETSGVLAELLAETLRRYQSLLYHGVEQGGQKRGLLESGLLNDDDTGAYASLQCGYSMLVGTVSALGNTLAEQPLKPVPILSLKQRPCRRHQLPVNLEFHISANIDNCFHSQEQYIRFWDHQCSDVKREPWRVALRTAFRLTTFRPRRGLKRRRSTFSPRKELE